MHPRTWRYSVRDVANTFRELRRQKNMSIRQVEAATGVFNPHLSEIERGIRFPTEEEFAALSEFYGVSREGWTLMYVHSQKGASA